MINTLYIDGFKSLENLTLELKPGLNTLVGLNGCGKSNIVDALWFVSNLFENNLAEILDNLGIVKVNELFCLTREKREIHIVLNGTHRSECRNINKTQIQTSESLEDIVSLYTKYNLEYRIGLDSNVADPFTFREQRLMFEFSIGGLDLNEPNKLVVEFSKGLCEVKEYNMEEIENFVSHEVAGLPSLIETNFGKFKKNSVFTTVEEHFYPIRNLVKDSVFKNVYAIYPPMVRKDAYKIGTSQLQFDGSGLASKLYTLKQNDNHMFKSVIDGMKLISKNILDITVNYVKSRQKIEVNTKFGSNHSVGANKIIPLELMSDGILKWYALVTAMVSSKEPLVIEEPENYMSPNMQQLLITYLRDELDNRENFGVITSHSETLVDFLEPNELILVREKNGKTEASRILEIDKLVNHMRKSEYGLGWYFQSELLEFYCFKDVT